MKTIFLLSLISLGAVAQPQPITLGTHEGSTRIALSTDGSWAASTGDKTVKIWDMAMARELRTLPIEEPGIALAFTPDKKMIAVRVEHGVDLLELDTGKKIRRFESQTDGVPRIAISPDGRWLASGGSDHKARVWEMATGILKHELPHTYHLVFGVCFSPDSKRLISGAGDGVATHGEVQSWDLEAGKSLWRHEAKQIWMVTVMPDSSAAISADVEGDLMFHDWGTGEFIRKLETSDVCRAFALAGDGNTLAATARNSIEIWKPASGKSTLSLQGHTNWVLSLALTPDGSALISGSSDHSVRLWKLP